MTVQTCLHKCMLLRALGAQPRRRKPAFVTHDNEASLCGMSRPCRGEVGQALSGGAPGLGWLAMPVGGPL